jgi:putative Holliday junction resolvase
MTDGVVLAFDFGARRIGVAIGNGITREARPLAIVDAPGETRWPRIAALVNEWQPARLVVGVPRHPDGTPHEMTARCEKFARQLHGRHRLPVDTVDERYSSAVVAGGRDDEAAAVILQQWFHETAQFTPSPASGGGLRWGQQGDALTSLRSAPTHAPSPICTPAPPPQAGEGSQPSSAKSADE